MIFNKKQAYFENKINECLGNPCRKPFEKAPKTAPNNFAFNTILQHYKGIIQSDSFNLATSSKNTILTILKNIKVSKAAGLENSSGRFLKNSAKALAKHITDLCNLSIDSGVFPELCKIAKLKPIH